MIARILIALCLIGLAGKAQSAQIRPAIVFDMSNSIVLYAEEQDRLWHPASLTKIMTAYLVFEAIKEGKFSLEDHVVCSSEARSQAPSKLGLAVGKKLRVDKAIYALMVKSANDVAVMLAEKVSGTHAAFARKMTLTAKRLGMKNTRFVNANGLPDARQVTTARDMGILARAILADFPEHKHIYAKDEIQIGKRIIRSHNRLLKTFDGADGLKTGFICASGFNVVASATREGRQLVAVILGGTTSGARNSRAANLLQYGFDTYKWKELFDTDKLDNFPKDGSALGPIDIRRTVRACGGGPRIIKKKKKKPAPKKKKTADLISPPPLL